MASLLLCVLASGLASPGHAQSSRETDLAAIRQRAQELESRLEDIRRRKKGVVGDLVEADYELQLQGERLAEARRQLETARFELEVAERETAILQQRLADIRAAVTRRIVGLYRKGGHGALRLLLSARATDDILAVLRTLRFLVRRDVELRRSLNETQAEMADQLRDLRGRRRDVELLVDDESTRLAESRRLRRRRAELLAELESSERSVGIEYDRVVESENKLADLLARLVGGGSETLAGRSIQDYRGVLDRPMVGSIIRAFGPRRDPRYRTLVPHNGLQFAGLQGEKVRVVFPGQVLYAADLEGYGDTVIVLHPGRVFTLYAGLSGIEVSRDELLSIGQVIGAADGGLYFEIRQENRAVDPAEWIR
jgi:septal ring factor EnvC (AmiA/AmiB activator)